MPYGETLIRTQIKTLILTLIFFLTTELTEICRRPTDHREVINGIFRSLRVFRVQKISVSLCLYVFKL